MPSEIGNVAPDAPEKPNEGGESPWSPELNELGQQIQQLPEEERALAMADILKGTAAALEASKERSGIRALLVAQDEQHKADVKSYASAVLAARADLPALRAKYGRNALAAVKRDWSRSNGGRTPPGVTPYDLMESVKLTEQSNKPVRNTDRLDKALTRGGAEGAGTRGSS